MADPITTAIATAVASGMGQSLTDQAREVMTALVRRIREKFKERPAAETTLAAARDDPGSAERISEFAHALDEASREDPEFSRQIREIWAQIRLSTIAGDDAVVNTFHGRADKVVQLRDVHGDINIS
ncbi:MAG: hypothetical protein JO345_38445 [Streptosporangiaceae bacterium]|nr:hypothetical protein [Streptosporangiaceae bacterium]